VLKHGGHVVAFFGTRTYDWGVMAMRIGGFEIRDCIQWVYGSGFPKSHNISKAIDKQDMPTEQAKQWEGWGSALKPAHEDLVLARKPFQFSSDFVYLYENVVYNLKLQICQSKLFAKDVKEIFTLSQKDLKEVELDFAQWSVGKPFNTMEDLLVLMDMLQLEMKKENMTLNIVLSWLNTLVELWNVANTYTTETESSTITELRILNSLEWESIFQNITLLKDNKTNGLIANVLTVESLFSVLNLRLNDILTHSAKESVTLKESEKTFVPNSEQIVLARKPLEKGLSIAENVLKWGTGAINIDGCRVKGSEPTSFLDKGREPNGNSYQWSKTERKETFYDGSQGRFPANLILTHHPECECKILKNTDKESNEEHWTCHDDCPIKIMDEQSGESKSTGGSGEKSMGALGKNGKYGKYNLNVKADNLGGLGDSGGASRFFYVAKASKSERNFGNEKNFHPTVKPVKLMQYLVRLITPPNGKVLDPFNGSGTTGIACTLENFEYTGIELDADYCKISEARINEWSKIDEYEQYKYRGKEDKGSTSNSTQSKLF
jgi:DNA modification methylase